MFYIDASRYSNTAQRTGVENYSFHLINALVRLAQKELVLVAPKKIDLPVEQITIPFPRLWTQIRLSWECWRNKQMVNLFVPSHVMPIHHPENTVITIHDVAFKRLPQAYGWLSRTYLDWATGYAVRHARSIIAVSETTKADLIEFYKADPSKIVVIPLGFEADPAPTKEEAAATMARFGLNPQRYFLFVGRIETKKNVATLIKAFEEFATANPGHKLVLAGKPGVGGEEILKSIRHPDIVVTGYVDETTKRHLLSQAMAFVFPSLFEGFGIPLLEAMASKLPILSSKIPTSWEMAKDNALFFEPEDASALAGLMTKLAGSESLRRMMVQNHEATLAKYSWDVAARKTLEVLGSAQR